MDEQGTAGDDRTAAPMPVGWREGAARVRALVERTDLVPAALFTAARPGRRGPAPTTTAEDAR